MSDKETNTVTIPIDEYFELRTKADMNAFLMNELGELRGRLQSLENRLFDLERKS